MTGEKCGAIIHCFHNPNGARIFIEPVVAALRANGVEAELWCGGKCTWLQMEAQARSAVPGRIIELDTPLDPFRAALRLFKLWRAFLDVQPRAVQAHLTRGATLPLLAALLSGVRVRVYHNHGMAHLGRGGLQRIALRFLEVMNHMLATHVLMVSESNREAAIRDGLPKASSVTVCGHGSIAGIELDRLTPAKNGEVKTLRNRFGLPGNALVIGFQGRASAHKGLPDLVKAFELAGLDRVNARVFVAGTSMAQARRLLGHEIPQWMTCLGGVDDMPSFYRACDFIVMPSWYEGLGLAVLEAAACGLPSIASDVPGLRCTMEHGHTGFLTPAKSPESLSKAMLTLAENESLRRRMGHQARKFVCDKFERSAVLAATVSWTRTVLEQSC